MMDREHEEWLEDEKARKALKKHTKTPSLPQKKVDDAKVEGPIDDEDGRVWWRGET